MSMRLFATLGCSSCLFVNDVVDVVVVDAILVGV